MIEATTTLTRTAQLGQLGMNARHAVGGVAGAMNLGNALQQSGVREGLQNSGPIRVA